MLNTLKNSCERKQNNEEHTFLYYVLCYMLLENKYCFVYLSLTLIKVKGRKLALWFLPQWNVCKFKESGCNTLGFPALNFYSPSQLPWSCTFELITPMLSPLSCQPSKGIGQWLDTGVPAGKGWASAAATSPDTQTNLNLPPLLSHKFSCN